jgi:hypothetical protein
MGMDKHSLNVCSRIVERNRNMGKGWKMKENVSTKVREEKVNGLWLW